MDFFRAERMLYRRAWSIGSGGKRAILITWAKMPSKTSGSSSTNFSINILFCACEGISNKCSFRLYPLSLLYVYLYYVYSTANQSGTAKKHLCYLWVWTPSLSQTSLDRESREQNWPCSVGGIRFLFCQSKWHQPIIGVCELMYAEGADITFHVRVLCLWCSMSSGSKGRKEGRKKNMLALTLPDC